MCVVLLLCYIFDFGRMGDLRVILVTASVTDCDGLCNEGVD